MKMMYTAEASKTKENKALTLALMTLRGKMVDVYSVDILKSVIANLVSNRCYI